MTRFKVIKKSGRHLQIHSEELTRKGYRFPHSKGVISILATIIVFITIDRPRSFSRIHSHAQYILRRIHVYMCAVHILKRSTWYGHTSSLNGKYSRFNSRFTRSARKATHTPVAHFVD